MSNHDPPNHDRRIMSENPGVYMAMKSAVIFILFLVFFSLALETTSVFFFVRGEPVLVLKSSSLRAIYLLSTALFVSGEVLIGARAKRGQI